MQVIGRARLFSILPAMAVASFTFACAPLVQRGETGSVSSPPIQGAAVAGGPFVLFFEPNSAEISVAATEILKRACKQQRQTGLRLMISGHADRVGSKLYNSGLSKRRAQAVREHLIACGVPAAMISEKAYGEAVGLVNTPDNVPEAQNRRVEIYIQ